MDMGNLFGLPNEMFDFMRRDFNPASDNFSDSSSSESEDDDECADQVFTTDTNINSNQCSFQSDTVKFSSPEMKINLETVKKLEAELEFYEFISMIFLLYNTNREHINTTLQVMQTTIWSGPEHFTRDKLSCWARTNPERNWRGKLVEALAVIQNYKLLAKLGYSKREIDERFQPMKDATLYLARPRKMLYRICEFLTKEKAKLLIEYVRKNEKFENDITIDCNPIYLEYHILFWINNRCINIDEEVSLKSLTKHLKVMDYLDKVEEIEAMVKSLNNELAVQKPSSVGDRDAYEIINPDKVGLCVVINMDQFEKNVDKRAEYKDKLANPALSDRKGSLIDVDNLKRTFTNLKFDVITKDNIFHDKLEQKIQQIVRDNFKDYHSVLILCVLSHGSEGVIYAANSVPVPIQKIQNIISGPSALESLLVDKPKVLIVQACQGSVPLYTESDPGSEKAPTSQFRTDSQMCFDGPGNSPRSYADLLICKSIIEGFFAVRSQKEGTKYIQELCKCLKKYYNKEHLLEIITKVHKNLNSEEMHIRSAPEEIRRCKLHPDCSCVYMTPTFSSTLRKKLYFVPESDLRI